MEVLLVCKEHRRQEGTQKREKRTNKTKIKKDNHIIFLLSRLRKKDSHIKQRIIRLLVRNIDRLFEQNSI